MLIVLAKLTNAELTGRFAFAFAITAPVFLMSDLQSRAILATDATDRFRFSEYRALRAATTLLAAGVIAVLAASVGYGRETTLIIAAITLAKAFESMSDIYHGALQQREQMHRIAISLIVKGILSLGVLSLIVSFTGSLLWGAIGLAVTWGVVLAVYDIPVTTLVAGRQGGSAAIRLPYLVELGQLGIPFGLVTMLVALKSSVPRIVIERQLGEAELGIFAAMAYAPIAGALVVNSLAQSAAPRLARYYADGDRKTFLRVLIKLMAAAAALALGGVALAALAGREILTVLYRPEYATQVNVFLMLVAAAGLGYVAACLGCALVVLRVVRSQVPLQVALVVATALTCLWLVPEHGLAGAAVAELVAAVLQLAGVIWLVGRALQDQARARTA